VPQLSDKFTVHGASYVRPPIQPIPIDRAFEKMDTFSWRGREIWCAETAGNSPGSMSYLHGIAPDLILGGHSWAIENPGPLIERFIAASDELRAALVDLTNEKDDRLWFDPYWARMHPYRVNVKRSDAAETSSALASSDSIHSRTTATAGSSTIRVASCGIWPGPRRFIRS